MRIWRGSSPWSDKRHLPLLSFLVQPKNSDILDAYAIKQQFCAIWAHAERREHAFVALLKWFDDLAEIKPHVRRHFIALEKMLKDNLPDVLAYFDWPLTNAPTEAMNRSVRRVNSAGQGLSFPSLRFRARAYSRAKIQRLFFCDRCLKRTPISKKIVSSVKTDWSGQIFLGDTFYLCKNCHDITEVIRNDLGELSISFAPQEPRIASAPERRAIRARRMRGVRVPSDHPDLFS